MFFMWKCSLDIGLCVQDLPVPLDQKLSVDERKQRDVDERENLVLWKKPLLTLYYFTLELLITLKEWIWRWDRGRDAIASHNTGLIL